MAIYTDKKTGRYFYQFVYQGVTYKKRLPENISKRDAGKLETKFKNTLFFEANGIETKKDIVYEKFLAEYFLPFAEKYYVKGSYDNAVLLCKESLKFFKGKNLRRIIAADVENFKNYRAELKTKHDTERKPATVVRELGVISKIFSYAVTNEFLEFNPCSRVSRPVFDNLQNRTLSTSEIDSLLNEIKSPIAKDIVILILHTGLRQNDALGLRKFNVDFERRTIALLQGKTKRRVEIPMNNVVFDLLSKYRYSGSELFFPSPKTGGVRTSLKKTLTSACGRLKIKNFGTRVLRRTFGTRLSELNYSSSVKAKLLGHTDLRSVHRYERESDILREAVESLENNNPAKILLLVPKADEKRTANG